MIYKYRSIKEVIEKVLRDSGSPDDYNWEDLMVWSAEALEFIGAHQQFLRRITGDESNPDLDITNYKAKLPCDFYKLEQVAVNGEAAHYAGNTFHHLMAGDCCSNAIVDTNWETLFQDNFNNSFTNLGESTTSYYDTVYTYDINDNYITLNVAEGKVCIAYIAIPLDEDGFPKIPDDVSYMEAVSRYCIMKMDNIAYRRGKITKDIWQDSERQWTWYAGQAKGKANAPSLDKMELIKKRFLKLIPEIDQHKLFFKS